MNCKKTKSACYRNWSAVGLAALAVSSAPLRAADAPASYDPAFVEGLIHRLESAETEIKELKSKPAAPVPAAEMPAMSAADVYPNLQFHGFGDVNYQAANRAVNNTAQTTGVNYQQAGNSPGSYNSFYWGEIDLFVSSQLAQHWSVLLETVLSAGTDNNAGLDVERIQLSWKPSEYFNVDAGRFHTQMGYYNTAFHHGTWFQTAVGRPSFLEFEDSGGLLPVHSVGFSIHGAVPSGSLNAQYYLEIANGRAYTTNGNSTQNLVDGNQLKAINFSLFAKPDWFPGGQFGAGVYHDTVTPDGQPNTDELIPNAHIVYHNSAWEILAEGFIIRHAPKFGSAHYTSLGYVQVSRKIKLFTPYGRFTYVNASQNDPIYTQSLMHAGAHYGPTFGLRYDVSSYVALKAQYDLMFDTAQKNESAVTLQAAFTF